jgi:uncharacterized membrane protein YbhN (UPF0104 family)
VTAGARRRAPRLSAIVGTLVGLALFAYVIEIASHSDLLGGLGTVVVGLGWLMVLLAIPFFVLRLLTWRLLLAQVGIVAPLRPTLAAFCAGELSKSLPFGVYLESYAIARLAGLGERGLVAAAVATTGLDVSVGAVTFAAGMLIGLPGVDWFRPLVIGITAAWIVVYLGLWLWVQSGRASGAIGRVIGEAAAAARSLLRPALLRAVATTSAYLAISVIVLWMILEALGLGSFGIGAAVTVVVITALVNVILPIPIELGITEISGVGVLSSLGVEPHQAAVVMLGYRLATSGALTIVALPLLVYLRGAYGRVPSPA